MVGKLKDISSQTTKQWRSILIIYVLQLLVGFCIAASAYSHFDGVMGNSLELDRLASGFDRSIFSDIVNQFPGTISFLRGRFGMALLLYLFMSIFLHAGLLGSIKKHEYSFSSFLKNAKKYFFRFAGIALIALLKASIILAVIWLPFVNLIGNPLETFHSEKTFIWAVVALFIVSILLLIIIWLWSALTRFHLIDGDHFVFAMKSGWYKLKASFTQYWLIGMGLICVHIMIIWLYTLLVDDWGAETWFCVLGLIFIQQIFSVARIWLRTFAYIVISRK